VECLKYLEQNPAFDGFMDYEPILWYSDKELSTASGISGDINTGNAWHKLQSKAPEGVMTLPAILASDVTHGTNFSGDGKVHPVYASSGHI
jgi:Plavaka transposase